MVSLEAEFPIGFYRVHAAILQFVSLQFIHQPDSAAFLRQIENDSATRARCALEGHFELRATIASLGVKHVARQALRMDADERRVSAPNLAMHQRDGAFRGAGTFNAENRELAISRRQLRARHDPRLARFFLASHQRTFCKDAKTNHYSSTAKYSGILA